MPLCLFATGEYAGPGVKPAIAARVNRPDPLRPDLHSMSLPQVSAQVPMWRLPSLAEVCTTCSRAPRERAAHLQGAAHPSEALGDSVAGRRCMPASRSNATLGSLPRDHPTNPEGASPGRAAIMSFEVGQTRLVEKRPDGIRAATCACDARHPAPAPHRSGKKVGQPSSAQGRRASQRCSGRLRITRETGRPLVGSADAGAAPALDLCRGVPEQRLPYDGQRVAGRPVPPRNGRARGLHPGTRTSRLKRRQTSR